MSFITLDFETYYSKDFSLSKMTTEEYIRSPEFQVIGVGVKIDDGETVWVTEEIWFYLSKLDWKNSAVLMHNALFDGAILEWIYHVKPAFYYDTLCMARAIHGVEAGGSLASLVERYKLGAKGTEVVEALGKYREDFSPADLDRYGAYCRNDVELTYALFAVLNPKFPSAEYDLIDMTIKMFTRPQLMLDDALLVERLEDIKREKSELLSALISKMECETEEDVRKKLSSNKKFAEVLHAWGVEAPMKVSKTTGKPALALAKTDEGFITLTEHEDPFIQQLCAVRLGTKSTIEESRVARFIDIGARNRGFLPVPLKYYGAHTGRWAGYDKVNFQNLPSRDKKKKALKNAVIAPLDHLIINCDSSQIEARVLAWWAGQDDVTAQFARGEDVYSIFASKIYKKTITKANPVERFVGKTCILGLGYGTGAEKLRHTLKTSPPGADIPIEQCKEIVSVYRSANYRIPELWTECDEALQAMLGGVKKPFYLGKHECVQVTSEGIKLPNGLYIRYPKLRIGEKGKQTYESRRGEVLIWGGAMVENIVQALARIIVGVQLTQIDKVYPLALTVHDAGLWVVHKDNVKSAEKFIVDGMSTAPDWAAGLPVTCELKYAERYGDC